MYSPAQSYGANDAPTIDDIDASKTPSLVGYWKGYDMKNFIVPDHSGNGFDLTFELIADKTADTNPNLVGRVSADYIKTTALSRFPGFVSMGFGWGLMRNVTNELLENTGKIVITSAQFATDTDPTKTYNGYSATAIDFDIGTYWAGSDGGSLYTNYFAPATGFNLMSLGPSPTSSQMNFRVSDGTDSYIRGMTGNLDGVSRVGMAGYYDPLTPSLSVNIITDDVQQSIGTSGAVIPTVIPPQKLNGVTPYFGVRAQNGYSPNWGIRDFQVWMFDSMPYSIAETLAFLTRNPGKIPPWLVGK